MGNTRYVGVATEWVVKQLHQEDDVFIHCIGHSLGAHTCGFFGNAVTNDTDYPAKTLIDRITALDPAGPLFTKENFEWTNIFVAPDPIESDHLRDNERLERTDARKVIAIHTDSDRLGIVQSVGEADFYIGNNLNNLGSDQSNRQSMVCDHSRSHQLMRQSISHQDHCWAHFTCAGESQSRGCTVDSSCQYRPIPDPVPVHQSSGVPMISSQEILAAQEESLTYPGDCRPALSPRIHFGYWWDGTEGDFGVVLDDEECWQCLDDGQCSAGNFCDVVKHVCVAEECLRDEHCSSGTCDTSTRTCEDCGSKRKKREVTGLCSTEPAEACKAEGGYCGDPGACTGTVLDNKCPGGQDNKCCTAFPVQEAECEAAGGDCLDTCDCPAGDFLHGYCPSQPNSIKCCPRTTQPLQCPHEEEEEEEEVEDCSRMMCRSGLSTSCSNGRCDVSCDGTVQCQGLRCNSISSSCSNGDCKLTCNGGSGSMSSSASQVSAANSGAPGATGNNNNAGGGGGSSNNSNNNGGGSSNNNNNNNGGGSSNNNNDGAGSSNNNNNNNGGGRSSNNNNNNNNNGGSGSNSGGGNNNNNNNNNNNG